MIYVHIFKIKYSETFPILFDCQKSILWLNINIYQVELSRNKTKTFSKIYN